MTEQPDQTHADDHLGQRLRTAYPAVLDDGTRTRHHAALDAALSGGARGRRWLAAIASTAALTTATTGLAVAAESSAPGDLLYPLKRATEVARSVFDDDVAARHRVEELATLLARDAEAERLESALDDATATLGQLGTDDADVADLTAELDRLAAQVIARLDVSPQVDVPAAGTELDGVPGLPGGFPWPSDLPTVVPPADPTPSAPAPTDDPATARDPGPDHTSVTDAHQETHAALDAGTVTIEVSSDGVRLVSVSPADGWTWQADRDDEPDSLAVGFTNGQRSVVLLAFHGPDGLEVQVRELTRQSAGR